MPAGGCAHRDNAAPGADQFIERLSYFMTLVGLTALIVGGAGIANAVSRLRQPRAPMRSPRSNAWAPLSAWSSASISPRSCSSPCSPSPSAWLPARWRLPWPRPRLRDHPSSAARPAQVELRPLALAPRASAFWSRIAFTMWPLPRTRHVPASALFRHRIAHVAGWPGMDRHRAPSPLAFALMRCLVYASFDDRAHHHYLSRRPRRRASSCCSGSRRAIVASARPAAASRAAPSGAMRSPISIARDRRRISVILALGLGLTLFVTLALTDRTISTELTLRHSRSRARLLLPRCPQ